MGQLYLEELHRLTAGADNWNRDSHPMTKNQYGVWEITLPAKDGHPAIPHSSKVKVSQGGLKDWPRLTKSGLAFHDNTIR